eukprot:scaffold189239_cov23-Tisochrysis_lutea.AAC.1
MVAHSAVISASGTLHTHGRIRKPRMVSKAPPEDTASCQERTYNAIASSVMVKDGGHACKAGGPWPEWYSPCCIYTIRSKKPRSHIMMHDGHCVCACLCVQVCALASVRVDGSVHAHMDISACLSMHGHMRYIKHAMLAYSAHFKQSHNFHMLAFQAHCVDGAGTSQTHLGAEGPSADLKKYQYDQRRQAQQVGLCMCSLAILLCTACGVPIWLRMLDRKRLPSLDVHWLFERKRFLLHMRWSVWVVRGLSMHGLGGDVMEMLEGVSRGSQPFFKKQAELH